MLNYNRYKGPSHAHSLNKTRSHRVPITAYGYSDISIVNQLGVEVAHLFSGELAAGEHEFRWEPTGGLPDGMYECLVRMNGRVEKAPVMLLR